MILDLSICLCFVSDREPERNESIQGNKNEERGVVKRGSGIWTQRDEEMDLERFISRVRGCIDRRVYVEIHIT